jgi:hypothetical protein
MPDILTIRFFDEKSFSDAALRNLRGTVGIYFIYLADIKIPYPFGNSRLVYVGMSESRENSIGNRLRDHRSGLSRNQGLTNYIMRMGARFTFHSIELLHVLGTRDIFELEYIFLTAFATKFGSNPICNNQSGILPTVATQTRSVEIDWTFFD